MSARTGMNASDRAGAAAARLAAAATPLAVAAGVALFGGHLLNEFAFDRALFQLYASGERTAWTWAAAMATLAAGVGAGLTGFVRRDSGGLGLFALLAFFALDDFVEVHERLGTRASDLLGLPEWVGPRAWTALYLPLLALALALGWRFARTLDAPLRAQLAFGTALLGAGFLLEAGGMATKRGSGDGVGTLHEIRAGAEEAAELAGWIVVGGTLLAAALLAARRPAHAPPRARAS